MLNIKTCLLYNFFLWTKKTIVFLTIMKHNFNTRYICEKTLGCLLFVAIINVFISLRFVDLIQCGRVVTTSFL